METVEGLLRLFSPTVTLFMMITFCLFFFWLSLKSVIPNASGDFFYVNANIRYVIK